MIIHMNTLKAYVIMPRYGYSLKDINETHQLSEASIKHLGASLLDMLETIHAAGYVYNDLRPDNILVSLDHKMPNEASANIFEGTNLQLVDFCRTTKYLD
jgi:serine/threonine protein kinase